MKYPFFNTQQGVIRTATGTAGSCVTSMVSCKNGCQNFSYVHSSRKHWKCKYCQINWELKTVIGVRGWNIATKERNVGYMEIEIVTFVINGSVKLTGPFRSTGVNLGTVSSKNVSLCCVFDFKFNGINLVQVFLKLRVVNEYSFLDIPVWEIEPRCRLFLSQRQQRYRLYKIYFIQVEKDVG